MTFSWGAMLSAVRNQNSMYDASNPSQGWYHATNLDKTPPVSWGTKSMVTTMEEYPEGLTVRLMLALQLLQ